MIIIQVLQFLNSVRLNAINNDDLPDYFDLITFRSEVKTMYFYVRNQLVVSD